MRISIEHRTRYEFATDASYSIQSLRLRPPDFDGQAVISWSIASDPESRMFSYRDAFGNLTQTCAINRRHRSVEIRASGVVEIEDRAGVVRGLAEATPVRLYLRRTALTAAGPEIAALVAEQPPAAPIAWLHALMNAIRARVDYVIGATDSTTTAQGAYSARKGVCQDHAHIFIAAARLGGFPARYVTGYLLIDSDAHDVAHHAWAEAWVEGLGWVGFDVANNICPNDRYVRLCAALDARDAAPVRGARRGGDAETLAVAVLVQRGESAQ